MSLPSPHSNPFRHRQPLAPGRDAFFARIRSALGRSPGQPVAALPALDDAVIRQVAAHNPTLIDRFITKARANAMTVHRITSDALPPTLDACLPLPPAARCLLNAGDHSERLGLPAYLAAKHITAISWGSPDCRNTAFTCDAAITDCRAAVADAGSLLVWSDSSFGRSSTLVIPLHIVLLRASQILPDLIDALHFAHRDNPQQLPSNIVLINGPSKTADIEMNLITGVHGPKHLHIILLTDA